MPLAPNRGEAMLKIIRDRVLAFDLEWVPDPLAGRLLYGLPDDVAPEAAIEEMWRRGGATEDDPTPFLKLVLCRIVSIAGVQRRARADGEVSLTLVSLPADPDDPAQTSESSIVGRFLEGLGKNEPQLVGFNSQDADLRILIQRAVVLGLRAEKFAARPEKPWLGRDYFARDGEWSVDLKQVLGGFGKATPSLAELATQSGIPGKFDVDGTQVARLWLDGSLRRIVQYNEYDALTTYLVWLRVAHFCGHFTTEQLAAEEERVRALLVAESATPARQHLGAYLEEWDRLRAAIARGRS